MLWRHKHISGIIRIWFAFLSFSLFLSPFGQNDSLFIQCDYDSIVAMAKIKNVSAQKYQPLNGYFVQRTINSYSDFDGGRLRISSLLFLHRIWSSKNHFQTMFNLCRVTMELDILVGNKKRISFNHSSFVIEMPKTILTFYNRDPIAIVYRKYR